MKKRLIHSAVAALALMLGAAGSANAFTITAGDIKFTIDNYDSGTTNYGDTLGTKCTTTAACDAVPGIVKAPGSIGSTNTSADTMGIFSVALITNTLTDATLFTKGVDGYLTGLFGNLIDQNVSVVINPFNGATTTVANAIGGTVSLYKNAVDYNPTLGPTVTAVKDLNNNMYPGITGGSLYLQGVFVPGVIAGDAQTTYQSIFANTGFAGNGSGFIDLTGGSALTTFNTNGYGSLGVNRDLFLTTTFSDTSGRAAANGWTVLSAGQAEGAAIPEPGSIALLSIGALFAGLLGRRRRKVAA
jgi:hypothetical protein